VRELAQVKVIAISASAFEHNRAQCLAAGADDFLAKPFRREKLLHLLSTHLGLELTCSADGAAHSPPAENAMALREEVRVLLDLARRGDIEGLLERVHHLEQSGAGDASFAARLRTLTENYQMKQLRQWLESLNGTP
jgi:CheY-like chemotaxis protein